MRSRVLYLLAAALTAAALALPLWGFAMAAPQYPGETLHVRIGPTGLGGDVGEVATLQHYIGVSFPSNLPELPWARRGIAALAALMLAAAFTSGRGLGRAYRAACAAAFVLFLTVSAAAVQARLYRVGHERDRHAPIRAVHDFTPPLVGPAKVANFTVWSYPHLGGVLLLAASVLAIVGVRRQRVATLVFCLALLPARALARTWTVGGVGADFPFIAPAIAAASGGDVIEVRAGVYREDLVVDRRLTIVGIDRPTLIGTGIGTVVTIVAPQCELTGLTIEGSGTGLTNAMDAGVLVASNGNRIVNNVLRRVFYGVVVTNAMHNEVADNEIQGLRELPFGQRGDGIYLYRAPENFVARNRVSGQRDAIYLQYAPRGRVIENTASSSRYALHDMFSDDTVIARNTFADSAVGANIMNSRRIRLETNRIVNNRGVPGVGLTLKDCDDSTARQNTIARNARGLLLEGSSTNRFVDNAFVDNDTAVTLFSSAEANAFSGNQFVENWSDVVLSGRDSGTRWTVDGRGNVWDRYRGFDFDGDGTGDSPHPVVGAFERIESSNQGVRLFLRSPAALGLELAARLGSPAPEDAVDAKPLFRPPAPAMPIRRAPMAAVLAIACAAVLGGRKSWF